MASKRSSSKAGTEAKRKRKMMTIAEKIKLLDMLKEGRSCAATGRHFAQFVVSLKKFEGRGCVNVFSLIKLTGMLRH
uniref:HTH psq-type domain-containing protein n=1 Tax=Pygocentrus nattereri TaxID=42514 RepID=A0A3B4E3U7_PYGNA